MNLLKKLAKLTIALGLGASLGFLFKPEKNEKASKKLKSLLEDTSGELKKESKKAYEKSKVVAKNLKSKAKTLIDEVKEDLEIEPKKSASKKTTTKSKSSAKKTTKSTRTSSKKAK